MNFRKYRDAYSYPTKIDIAMLVSEQTKKDITAFKAEFKELSDRLQFTPMFITGSRKTKCRELWRGNLTVYWDGLVTPCCVDSDGWLTIGNANREKICRIFNSSAMQKLRNAHITGNFPEICRTCSEYHLNGISSRFS